jgi:hypothetical protein
MDILLKQKSRRMDRGASRNLKIALEVAEQPLFNDLIHGRDGRRATLGLPEFSTAFGGSFRRIVQTPGGITMLYDVGQGQGWQRNIVMTASPLLPAVATHGVALWSAGDRRFRSARVVMAPEGRVRLILTPLQTTRRTPARRLRTARNQPRSAQW